MLYGLSSTVEGVWAERAVARYWYCGVDVHRWGQRSRTATMRWWSGRTGDDQPVDLPCGEVGEQPGLKCCVGVGVRDEQGEPMLVGDLFDLEGELGEEGVAAVGNHQGQEPAASDLEGSRGDVRPVSEEVDRFANPGSGRRCDRPGSVVHDVAHHGRADAGVACDVITRDRLGLRLANRPCCHDLSRFPTGPAGSPPPPCNVLLPSPAGPAG